MAHQAPLSTAFSRQEYWSGLPFPPPRDLSNPGMEPMSLKSPALAGRFFTAVKNGKPEEICSFYFFGFPSDSVVKNLPAMQEPEEAQVWSLGRENPLEKDMATHGQRSLADCSPQGNKEAGMTEGTLCTHSLPQWKQVEAARQSSSHGREDRIQLTISAQIPVCTDCQIPGWGIQTF